MSQSFFLVLKAIISVAFGTALILVPAPLLSIFGVPLDMSGTLVARLLGVDMMGIGFVCWYSRKSFDGVIKEIILGLFIADTVGSIILVIAQLKGVMNALGWINVLIWLFLTIGLGYLRFLKKEPNNFSHSNETI